MGLRKAKLVEKKDFTDDVIELTFQTDGNFEFEAGQFVTFKVDDQVPPCFRAYSIASCPKKENDTFYTCIKIVDGGRGSNWLGSLKIGDEINFLGPNGKFTFKNSNKNAFFIATGTGITPFNSMIEDQLRNKDNKNKINLLFGLRHIKNIYYDDFYGDLEKEFNNFTATITLSRPEDESWTESKGRVTKVLEERDLDAKNTDYYICGLKAMINEVEKILKDKGVPEDSIHLEKYD